MSAKSIIAKSVLGLALLLGPSIQAQFSLDWTSIDGGGGHSTDGFFTLTGTLGQPDAGVMSGGGFTLAGGFWGGVGVIQSAGAPLLTVRRTLTNTVVVFWPLPDAGWRLQSATNLSAAVISWTEIAAPYQTNQGQLFFTEPTPVGHKFYRLHKP